VRLKWIFLTVTGFIVMQLAGCATNALTPTTESASPKGISAEAANLLAQAEADIAYARAKFALWTTAESALAAAREAALRGDSTEVMRQAGFASGQVRLGIKQLDYPSTERK
jgi:hypothetical protein